MTDPSTLAPEAILAVPTGRPEMLFTGDADTAKREWKALAKAWHPDRNKAPLAEQVFEHVKALHDEAQRRIAAGTWRGMGTVRFAAVSGKTYEVRHRRAGDFELGEFYLGRKAIAWAVRKSEKDLFERAVAAIGAFRFGNEAMRKEIGRHLPKILATFETADRYVLVQESTPDLVLLEDLVSHLGGRMPAEHVAWMISSLENVACWLDWSGTVHGAIGPKTVFVSPKHHSVTLFGGWWYAHGRGAKLRALPASSLSEIRPDLLSRKVADTAIDLSLIRATARAALGDPAGQKIARDPSVPGALARWLIHPPAASARADYAGWEKAREAAFGPRRFVELAADPDQIYRHN